eukprot:gnl/Ergobibamus_cyprinoides/679.p2 GENE.gnl/Ergobibamus_cyprinoides/679~~gnl/Ergobibamus_cyprinoides/679.p2  ORF type:complete len:426 (+),score=212.63 gnl/Ergobibamus_cyprinoides/679:144-1421(+)
MFLVASQIPLYGLRIQLQEDKLYWMRMIFASTRGTLMELGIGPTMTASLVLQLLMGAGLLSVDQRNKEERALFQGAQKLITIALTIVEAVAYVYFGMYGPVAQLGVFAAWMIIAQLSLAGIMVTLLDEVVQKGWGIGSGISLFIATNVCEKIVWSALSFTSVNVGNGKQFEGCLIALVHLLITREDKLAALREAFFRQNLPNVFSMLVTCGLLALIIYLQQLRANIPVQSSRQAGQRGMYPIKLFYQSNTPVMIHNALTTNVFMLSQWISRRWGDKPLVGLIGRWQESEMRPGQSIPVGGLVSFMSAPASLTAAVHHPVHFVGYVAFVLISTGFLSHMWLEVANNGPEEIALQLKQQGLMMPGYRQESTAKVLRRYIPVAAALGGVVIGALTVVADLCGAIGSGTGLLLMANTIYQTYTDAVKEM